MKITATILALYAPSLSLALVGNDWAFTKCPSEGLNDVTFPFNIANAPRRSGYYFAQQFYFRNVPQGGYAGLQPREDANGQAVVHSVFSSFADGTTTTHENCHTGADGGPGVSCAFEMPGDYSHTYNVAVENIGGTTWRGTVIDGVTGDAHVIGEWTLPSSAGKITNGSVGFVEYYLWNDGKPSHDCRTLPKTEATFLNPMSNTNGASGGRITNVYEYGDCVGQAGFSVKQLCSGHDIAVGFE